MARSNSPGYPSMSLPKAIAQTRRMWDADRTNPIDRVTAAKHMGYAGQSGASDKALGSIAHYGLTEKTGKGEIRVSRLALDILCPDPTDPDAEARAIRTAGMNPQIFKDLRSRFPGHVSEESLRNYLIREGFNNVAIPPLMNAYFETFRFLEQFKDAESGSPSATIGGESDPLENETGAIMDDLAVQERPATTPPAPPPAQRVEAGEAEWMRNPLSRDTSFRLLVTGKMGSREIGKLITLLQAQKAVLDDDEDEADPYA